MAFYGKERIIMNLKIGKFEAHIPNWLVILGVLAGENMYTNHCKVKLAKTVVSKDNNSNDPKDKESQ
jgi:hypothetical protein